MGRLAKLNRKPRLDSFDETRRRTLGELLRRFRRQAHLSQAAVARTLGYRRQSDISHIESIKRILDPIELENFAHLYGKSLNDFATWQPHQRSTEELRARAARGHEEALKFQRRYYKKKTAKRESDSVGPVQP